jgi:plastocyanin
MTTRDAVRISVTSALLVGVFTGVGLVPTVAQSPSAPPSMSPAASIVLCQDPAASPALAASPAVAMSPQVTTSPVVGACPTGAAVDAAIRDFEFEPAGLTVGVGTTVRWTNEGPSSHTVTANDRSFDSGALAQGATFEHTFDAAGTFGYFCEIHADMSGTLIVE